jgi:hypothetical protein
MGSIRSPRAPRRRARALSVLVLTAGLVSSVLPVTMPAADAAQRRSCRVIDLHALRINGQNPECRYRPLSNKGRVTVGPASEWIVNVLNPQGHNIGVYYCLPRGGGVCLPKTFTFPTVPHGRVSLFVINGVGIAGDA